LAYEGNLETAQIIFDSGKNYHHCLFFCHLILEKALKANVVKATGKIPPRSLAKKLLAKTKEQFEWMEKLAKQ